MIIDFNERAAIVHENNAKWWVDINTLEPIDRNKGEMLMLVLTELAEAAEGIRKGGLMDDHLPHRKMAEVELADAEIRLLDFAGGFGYELRSDVINRLFTSNFDHNVHIIQHNLAENQLEGLLDISGIVRDIYNVVRGIPALGTEGFTAGDMVSAAIFAIRFFGIQHGYDVEGAYHDKLEYNKTRKDHSLEERRKDGGKKA